MKVLNKILLVTAISLLPLSPVFCMNGGEEEHAYGKRCLLNAANENRTEDPFVAKGATFQHVKRAVRHFQKAIELGCMEAQYSLAIAYFKLIPEHPKYKKKGFELMRQAARDGVTDANLFLTTWDYNLPKGG